MSPYPACGIGLGRGDFRIRFRYLAKSLQHPLQVTGHVAVREPNYSVACTFQVRLAGGISLLLKTMHIPIQLHDQREFRAAEVHDVWSHRVLSPEFASVESSVSQVRPECPLRRGALFSEFSTQRCLLALPHPVPLTRALSRLSKDGMPLEPRLAGEGLRKPTRESRRCLRPVLVRDDGLPSPACGRGVGVREISHKAGLRPLTVSLAPFTGERESLLRYASPTQLGLGFVPAQPNAPCAKGSWPVAARPTQMRPIAP